MKNQKSEKAKKKFKYSNNTCFLLVCVVNMHDHIQTHINVYECVCVCYGGKWEVRVAKFFEVQLNEMPA